MKILLIGHIDRIVKIKEIISINYKDVEIESLEYSTVQQTLEICELIKEKQDEFNAVLFTGSIPFYLVNKEVIFNIPCDYIRRDNEAVLKVLLKIVMGKELDIQRISLDTYDTKLVYGIYTELGLSEEQSYIAYPDINISDDDYINKIFQFHLREYEEGRVNCCITALSNVYEKLVKKDIPAYLLDPSSDIIKESLERLQLKHMQLINNKTKMVVVNISIDLVNEHSMAYENEHQMFLNKVKAAEDIYMFANRLQAAIIEESFNRYILFCTKATLESETNNYKSIKILQKIHMKSGTNINIGIGHGKTAREAKYSASLALKKAQTYGANVAYIIYEGKTIVGPIAYNGKEDNSKMIDDKLYNISQETGVGINKIYELQNLQDRSQKDVFTSHEIGEELKTSLRNVNKIIKRLEEHNYAMIIGKKSTGSSGRPSRLIKFMFK